VYNCAVLLQVLRVCVDTFVENKLFCTCKNYLVLVFVKCALKYSLYMYRLQRFPTFFFCQRLFCSLTRKLFFFMNDNYHSHNQIQQETNFTTIQDVFTNHVNKENRKLYIFTKINRHGKLQTCTKTAFCFTTCTRIRQQYHNKFTTHSFLHDSYTTIKRLPKSHIYMFINCRKNKRCCPQLNSCYYIQNDTII
jgi:hypothetical protein